MNPPLISIITCTYNRAAFIDLCINSVENQTYKNVEHIFIDAFSTDGTVEKIREYMIKHPDKKIKLYQYPPKGIANAMNLGFKYCSGDIIHFLHTDDFYTDANALQRVVEHFENNPDKIWLAGNWVSAIGGKVYIVPMNQILKISMKLETAYNFISHDNTFVKREMLEKYGPFEETHKISVEYHIWLKAIKEDPPLIVDDIFTVFIVHNGSMSTSPSHLPRAIVETIRSWKLGQSLPLIGDPDETPILKDIRKLVDKINALELD